MDTRYEMREINGFLYPESHSERYVVTLVMEFENEEFFRGILDDLCDLNIADNGMHIDKMRPGCPEGFRWSTTAESGVSDSSTITNGRIRN